MPREILGFGCFRDLEILEQGSSFPPMAWGGSFFELPPQGPPHGGEVKNFPPPGSPPWGGSYTPKKFAPAAGNRGNQCNFAPMKQPAAGGNFLGLGTPVVQFTLIFAIQMWTFPQKSDFFQIRNTGNFSVLGKSTFSKSEIPEIFQKISGNYRKKKTLIQSPENDALG